MKFKTCHASSTWVHADKLTGHAGFIYLFNKIDSKLIDFFFLTYGISQNKTQSAKSEGIISLSNSVFHQTTVKSEFISFTAISRGSSVTGICSFKSL